MNYDVFAFFNQQLATMLREGIPLEGALKQLAAGMQQGPLREDITRLESDLAQGTPLAQALERRQLPEFYRRMVQLGARTNNLPAVLSLLADYYQRLNVLWSRLKGLMVYPVIVVAVSLALTIGLSFVFGHFLSGMVEQFRLPPLLLASMWIPPALLLAMLGLMIGAVAIPKWRARLRWRLPGFRETSLAQLAAAIALMLRNGTTLAEALGLAAELESASPARRTLTRWRALVEAGHGKPAQWSGMAGPFPPMFLWLVNKGGEDVAAGFQKAADLYQARANYRIELLLYGALPISILFLGQMVFWEIAPLMQSLIRVMNMIGDAGS